MDNDDTNSEDAGPVKKKSLYFSLLHLSSLLVFLIVEKCIDFTSFNG
jgi:hypothetical protein